MPFFKSIVMSYVSSLEGRPSRADHVEAILPVEELRAFRARALEDITGAVKYVLNDDAASYADSFRENIQGGIYLEQASDEIIRFLEEVELPHDLAWVEFDQAELTRRRVRRGLEPDDDEPIIPEEFGLRGFLIDDRSKARLTVTLFRSIGCGSDAVIDPIFRLHFERGCPQILLVRFGIDRLGHDYLHRKYFCVGSHGAPNPTSLQTTYRDLRPPEAVPCPSSDGISGSDFCHTH